MRPRDAGGEDVNAEKSYTSLEDLRAFKILRDKPDEEDLNELKQDLSRIKEIVRLVSERRRLGIITRFHPGCCRSRRKF